LRAKTPLLRRAHVDAESLAEIVNAIAGVRSVRINVGAESVIVDYDGASAARSVILDKLAHITLGDLRRHETPRGEEPSLAPLALRIGLMLVIPFLPPLVGRILTWAAIAPRVARGVRSLMTNGISVQVLDAAAVSLGAARGKHMTALVTDSLMESGDYLEESTQRRSEDLLERLLHPHPSSVWVERDGVLSHVPFSEVASGNIVVIDAGDLVPVDGVVIDGVAQVNQASVTGESVPVRKEAGADVIAGSTLESGRLRIEARRVGDETTTARVAAFIRESLAAKSETERLAEEFANGRVLVTMGLGAVMFVLTGDVTRLISVLLVDYSCAVKLSAPVTIRSTMSEGARQGILIKGGPSIEALARVDTFVFDKTGTLTRGDLTVTDVVLLAPHICPEERLLALTASIEEHSRHPVANAIVRAARRQGMSRVPHEEVDVVIAHGLKARVDGEQVLIGSRHFLQDHEGIDFEPYDHVARDLSAQGKLLLYTALGRTPVGIIALRDELRDDCQETMARLRKTGIGSLIMLSGDRKARAEALAKEVGIDKVFAELQPEEKAEILQGLRRDGHRIAFVGDGINDAPALVTADVGIAMPLGAEIARATADIVLLDDRLAAVADAREAAVNAMGMIRSNFRAAIGINTALFVAASAGSLSPIVAAVLHNGTTLALLGRALSAGAFSKPRVEKLEDLRRTV
jgi:heavy metal translocating P-type ATPase